MAVVDSGKLRERVDASWLPPRLSHRERARARAQRRLVPLLRRVERNRPGALASTLHRAVRSLDAQAVPFAVGGGVGRWIRGGPETSHDVDVLLRPDDLASARDALVAAGMRPGLVSAWGEQLWDGWIEVDLLCAPAGRAVTDAVLERAERIDVDGLPMPIVSLEDDFTFKLLALTERDPSYKDLLVAARCLREQVDWEVVRTRTTESPFAAAFFTIADALELTGGLAGSAAATCQVPVAEWFQAARPPAQPTVPPEP